MLIQHQISLCLWKPIQISNQGPLISHTLFADDIFLFAEASLSNAQSINMVLNTFANTSGLSVNKNKSKFFFSKSCPNCLTKETTSILDIPSSPELGKYLGFPILKRKPLIHDFQPILNSMTSKLNSWKSKFLNLAGCTTLAKSVLSSLPIHIM